MTFKQAMDNHIALMRKGYDNLLLLRPLFQQVQLIYDRYPEFHEEYSEIRISPFSGVSLHLHHVKAFRELMDILGDVMELGYECVKTEDSPYSGYREYNFGPLTIYAWLASDTPECKRVEVGRHLREEIDYKFVCD